MVKRLYCQWNDSKIYPFEELERKIIKDMNKKGCDVADFNFRMININETSIRREDRPIDMDTVAGFESEQ